MHSTTTTQQPQCHFGHNQPAVAHLIYQLPAHPRRSHYKVCAEHYANFSQADLVEVRWLDWQAGKCILAELA